jgi:ubiquinone/menaquinone biosynthesis C-methylase UbiE
MRLNLLEKALMINPLRAILQRRFEARRLKRMGGPGPTGRVLEMGCGRGFGALILFEDFGSERVDAFDLDLEMVRRAQSTLGRNRKPHSLWVADACRIPVHDAVFDTVFDFGVIHHVPEWRAAVAEAFRVLKPGGRFFVEEIPEKTIGHPLVKRLLDHPQRDRFDQRKFAAELKRSGFRVIAAERFLELFVWFVAQKPI